MASTRKTVSINAKVHEAIRIVALTNLINNSTKETSIQSIIDSVLAEKFNIQL